VAVEVVAFKLIRRLFLVTFLACAISACWDRSFGPVVRNDFAVSIEVSVKMSDGRSWHFQLEPNATFAQRVAGLSLKAIDVSSGDGKALLHLDASAIEATGLSEKKSVLVLAPGGAHAQMPE
jgi:hypothetical protein